MLTQILHTGMPFLSGKEMKKEVEHDQFQI